LIYLEKDAVTAVDADGIFGRLLADVNKSKFVRLTLQPGSTLAPHPVPIDACFFVVAGQGRIEVDGKTDDLQAGSLISIPGGALRGWTCLGDQSLELLAIKQMR
jgi:quercetin dioxygenase-like cupin family protein